MRKYLRMLHWVEPPAVAAERLMQASLGHASHDSLGTFALTVAVAGTSRRFAASSALERLVTHYLTSEALLGP